MMNGFIQFERVQLKHPSQELLLLNDLNFSIEKGDFVIILGENGAGKSSLFQLLIRNKSPDEGRIVLNGQDSRLIPLREWRKKVKLLTQSPIDSLFPSFTIWEHFQFMGQKSRQKMADYLYPFSAKLCTKWDEPVYHLSGGEKQALALALAVLDPPEVLLLDEHTSALDPQSAQRIMALTREVVREHRMSCLLSTHNLKMAADYGDWILMLEAGQVSHVVNKSSKAGLDQDALFHLYQNRT